MTLRARLPTGVLFVLPAFVLLAVFVVYPLIWTALTLVRGAVDGWYPYPFLDPANGGYGQVAVTAVAVTIGFFVISLAMIWVGNARSRWTA